ncbi:MAG: efflux RND transporter periplasmic adaptor subunit [Eubacteriales bacterium]|nr:efflux RND transporter periplasmic adaptor subunit [Eubacteriales bacterium]
MKKRILAVGGILIAVAAAGSVYWFYFRGSSPNASTGETVYVSTVSSLTGNSTGMMNRYAGVVEPQETVEVTIESGRKVTEVQVKTGEEVKQGQLLFEYDLSSIQEDLQQAKLDLDRLKNEALSLSEQITTLEKEKKKASQDNQLSYTIEIETNKMNLKKNEYDQTSKEAEIQKLQNATGNTEVRSTIDGVIQKIDTSKLSTDDGDSLDESSGDSMMSDSDSSSNAFITILSTGAYRIKGKINELNIQNIVEGSPVIIRSRADEDQIWRGTMGSVDMDNGSTEDSDSMMYYGMSSTDTQTSSSTYPFYVELESSEGLMLGQHVYIEPDNGQEDQKDGLWLSDFFIVDADSTDPYVWAADDKDKLEKRYLILGKYDEDLGEYEIVDGLTLKDAIAYPAENLTEGMDTSTSSAVQINQDASDMESSSGEESGWEENTEIIEESSSGELIDDFSDEDLVPMEEAPDGGIVVEEVTE